MPDHQANCGGQAEGSEAGAKHWDDVIKRNICGDIEALLETQDVRLRDKAGPLLDSVMAGIDAAGGCLYGFCKGSLERSVRFMTKEMHLCEELAGVVYDLVRCGMVHEGITKWGVAFHRGKPRCKDCRDAGWAGIYSEQQRLNICVDCFAGCFVKAVDGVADGKILYTPPPPGHEALGSVLGKLPVGCECKGNLADPSIPGASGAPSTSSRTPLDRQHPAIHEGPDGSMTFSG